MFSQGPVMIHVYGVKFKRSSWFVCLSPPLLSSLIFPSVSFPHHHPSLSLSWFPSSLLSVTVHYFPLSRFCHCPSISPSLASFPQSVWMHSPWWFALRLNRRTCCSASNWPERRRLKAPGCEHFAATSPTPSARLMRWVTSHSHAHTTKKGGSLSGHRQAGKESAAVYKFCLVVDSSPSSSWERSTIILVIRVKRLLHNLDLKMFYCFCQMQNTRM